ncbi:uncharacterized protein LOC130657796 [Hydractinia symbiolongicarpus]|uniref:uncharacterized protein LOC130657796 n=1 Tax=Hydractinia symbiolongicarpus TaxID=13093 RepID=UPI0025518684|nr:uncharacterized protein LOC130657796 [Hydractinia symbiolongicarpus]
MNDQFCEELAHPYLFPTGKFGYKVERDIKLSPTKYFNQRLLNYKQKFASNSDYIFYVLSTLQQLNMSSQINIAVKKVKTDSLTAGMLSKNFSETVQSCIAEDKGFQFMSPIKGTPAYWKRFLSEVPAMVKQLGLPTFFMTLSCADLRWNELISIIAKLNSENLTDEEIINLTYFERFRFLNLNPVLLARHFQYRVELFFKEIVVNGPLGKVKYCAIRVEFQIRGSPHIHSFLWVLNAPVLTENNIDKYIQFVDAIIKAYVPDREHERELFDLVTTYQVHSHSKSCRKTIVALPLSKDIDLDERSEILKNKEVILNKIKDYIDTKLNPKKKNILNPNQENFEITPTISEILDELDIPESEYYNALSISNDNDFQLYLKRPPNSCFINNYFDEGLLAWEANIDIQPVFNHYKAVTYMCAYFSKCEDETSQAMKQAAKEAFNSNKSYTEQMKLIAKVFTTKRECSVQEAVYLIMPELWLRKTFPKVVFANTNLPEKRYRMCRSKHKIDKLPEDSTDIFKRNMLDRYVDRPNPTFAKGKYAILDQFCYPQFLANYYLAGRFDDENDSQPTVLRDDNIERNHITNWFPAILSLMSSNEKFKCRKVKQVLRLYTPNKHKYPELYAHHLLMVYYPFRNECDLKSASGCYVEKLNEPGVLSIINEHKQTFEPFSDLIDTALSNLRTDLLTNQDAFTAHENDEVQDEMIETIDEIVDDENVVADAVLFDSEINVLTNSSEFLSDAELNPMISSLNYKQRQVFDLVYDWACRYIKNLSAIRKVEFTPLYIFLTGAGGCGKSHLIKTIYQAMSKVLSYKSKDLNKPKVFLVAPTGVAAININGTTIHTAFGIPVGHFGKNLPRLNDKRRTTLRNKLSELKASIVDEISMVSNLQLFYIHLRLIEIFACRDEIPFAGITVIECGDLYQLPPVQQRPVYADYKSDWLNLVHLWKLFEFAELTEVMRQKGDNVLIDLLNNVRIGKLDKKDEELLKNRVISPNDSDYPANALHIFAENAPAKNVAKGIIEKALNRNQSETGGLATELKIKVGARVMLTVNIDIADRLINGQIGTVKHVKADNANKVSKIYVLFDDPKAGKEAIFKSNCSNRWVPIERAEANIKLKTSKDTSPVIKRTQFPLMLSWACTVHKVQGLTLDKVVISFDLEKQRSFNNGQMYVALSKVTSLNGMCLTGKFSRSAIKCNSRATLEYDRLRNECVFQQIQKFSAPSHDKQLNPGQDTESIDNYLVNFSPLHNCSTDKFQSISLFFRRSIHVQNHQFGQGVTMFSFTKTSFSAETFNALVIYRKCNDALEHFYDALSRAVQNTSVHFILGDFNINAQAQPQRLSDVMHDFTQIVTEPTHLAGATLDHVYIKNSVVLSYDVKCFYSKEALKPGCPPHEHCCLYLSFISAEVNFSPSIVQLKSNIFSSLGNDDMFYIFSIFPGLMLWNVKETNREIHRLCCLEVLIKGDEYLVSGILFTLYTRQNDNNRVNARKVKNEHYHAKKSDIKKSNQVHEPELHTKLFNSIGNEQTAITLEIYGTFWSINVADKMHYYVLIWNEYEIQKEHSRNVHLQLIEVRISIQLIARNVHSQRTEVKISIQLIARNVHSQRIELRTSIQLIAPRNVRSQRIEEVRTSIRLIGRNTISSLISARKKHNNFFHEMFSRR